jgi:hypothetical protein
MAALTGCVSAFSKLQPLSFCAELLYNCRSWTSENLEGMTRFINFVCSVGARTADWENNIAAPAVAIVLLVAMLVFAAMYFWDCSRKRSLLWPGSYERTHICATDICDVLWHRKCALTAAPISEGAECCD